LYTYLLNNLLINKILTCHTVCNAESTHTPMVQR